MQEMIHSFNSFTSSIYKETIIETFAKSANWIIFTFNSNLMMAIMIDIYRNAYITAGIMEFNTIWNLIPY